MVVAFCPFWRCSWTTLPLLWRRSLESCQQIFEQLLNVVLILRRVWWWRKGKKWSLMIRHRKRGSSISIRWQVTPLREQLRKEKPIWGNGWRHIKVEHLWHRVGHHSWLQVLVRYLRNSFRHQEPFHQGTCMVDQARVRYEKSTKSSSMMFLKMDWALCQTWECKDSKWLVCRDSSFWFGEASDLLSLIWFGRKRTECFDLESVFKLTPTACLKCEQICRRDCSGVEL